MKPEDFVKSYKKSKYPKTAKETGCGEGLSGKICTHNNKKLNKSVIEFVRKYVTKKTKSKSKKKKADNSVAFGVRG